MLLSNILFFHIAKKLIMRHTFQDIKAGKNI